MANETNRTLILASASSRRGDLLKQMGCRFSMQAADIDESRVPREAPKDYVARLAQQKAQAIVNRLDSCKAAILAADTIVVQRGSIFGKPRDRQHAFQVWQQLADSQHQVLTAVCLVSDGNQYLEIVSSRVEFGTISEAQMNAYWQSGEPQDKAGGYAIQGLASAWVKLIHGSYSNIVGLPLRETNLLLQKVGHNWL